MVRNSLIAIALVGFITLGHVQAVNWVNDTDDASELQ